MVELNPPDVPEDYTVALGMVERDGTFHKCRLRVMHQSRPATEEEVLDSLENGELEDEPNVPVFTVDGQFVPQVALKGPDGDEIWGPPPNDEWRHAIFLEFGATMRAHFGPDWEIGVST